MPNNTILFINKYTPLTVEQLSYSFSELGFDEGRQGHEIPDHVDEDDGPGEGEVDSGVSGQVQHSVQLDRGVGVFLQQVMVPVHIAAAEPEEGV